VKLGDEFARPGLLHHGIGRVIGGIPFGRAGFFDLFHLQKKFCEVEVKQQDSFKCSEPGFSEATNLSFEKFPLP
jgi:hypothetical protein